MKKYLKSVGVTRIIDKVTNIDPWSYNSKERDKIRIPNSCICVLKVLLPQIPHKSPKYQWPGLPFLSFCHSRKIIVDQSPGNHESTGIIEVRGIRWNIIRGIAGWRQKPIIADAVRINLFSLDVHLAWQALLWWAGSILRWYFNITVLFTNC